MLLFVDILKFNYIWILFLIWKSHRKRNEFFFLLSTECTCTYKIIFIGWMENLMRSCMIRLIISYFFSRMYSSMITMKVNENVSLCMWKWEAFWVCSLYCKQWRQLGSNRTLDEFRTMKKVKGYKCLKMWRFHLMFQKNKRSDKDFDFDIFFFFYAVHNFIWFGFVW